MRTVGIVTWFGTENYGSKLQSIGLSLAIRELGYDPWFIQGFKVPGVLLRHPAMLYARVMNRLNKGKCRTFFVPEPYRISDARKERLRTFTEENYQSILFADQKNWKKAVSDRMIVAAGSDILWNPAMGYPAMNFLDFAYYADLPRFSYASSVGAPELPKKYYPAYRKYLGSMKAVGVREQPVADMLQSITGREVTRVADPSLLLSSREWDALAEKASLSVKTHPGEYILCYFVMQDPRYWEYIKRVQAKTGLQVIVLPMHHLDEQQSYDILRDGTPYEFVRLLREAAFICTDSFHACTLSLIYEKEFYLLRRTRKSEDAKYDDFLNRYHLTDRQVRDETVFERKPADYSFAREYLKQDREKSLAFLKDALDRCAEKRTGQAGRGSA